MAELSGKNESGTPIRSETGVAWPETPETPLRTSTPGKSEEVSPGVGSVDAVTPGSPAPGDASDEIRVQVVCRVRPLIGYEIEAGSMMTVTTAGKTQVVVTNKSNTRKFTFSGVYGTASRQHHVFEESVSPLLTALMDGFNATILAYGQSGSGKTYTMGTGQVIGEVEEEDLGILPRVVMELYRQKANPVEGRFDNLALSCTFVEAETMEDMMGAFERGLETRTVGSTSLNTVSSRSHAIFTITVRMHLRSTVTEAKLHLVDLAGSERMKRTHATGVRAKEGININKGLLVLGAVIEALSTRKSQHIPYRDSKLTRVLQDSLGGTSRTLFIACVSPADVNMDESLNTLKYATRAAAIRNRPKRNLAEMMGSEEFRLKMRNLESFLANDQMRDGTIPDLEAFGPEVLWAMLVKLHYKSEGKGMSGKSEESLVKDIEHLSRELARERAEHMEVVARLERRAALAESMLQAKEGAMRNMMTELRALEASKLIPSRALRQVEVAMTRQKTETSRWMDAFVRSRAKAMWEEANEDPDPAHPNAQPSPSPLAHAISAGPAFASLVRTTQPRTFGSLLVSQMRAQGMLPARQDGTPARVATPARTSTDGEAPHARGEDERLPASRMSSARGDGPSREQQQLNREALLSLRTLESLGGASVEALASGMRIGSRYPPPAPTRTPGSKTRWDRARGRSWAQGALGDLVAEAMLHGTTTPPGHGTQRQSRASSRRSSVLLGADGSRAEAARPGSAASVFRVSRSDNGNGEESAERVRWAEGQGETRGRGGEGGGEGQGGDSQLPELSQFTEGDVEKIRKIQAAGKLMLAKRKARRSLEGEFVKAGEKGGNVVEGEQEGGEGDGDGIAGEGGGKTEAGETGGAVECTKGEVAGEKKDMEGEEGNVGEEERGQDGKKRIAEDISGIDMKSDDVPPPVSDLIGSSDHSPPTATATGVSALQQRLLKAHSRDRGSGDSSGIVGAVRALMTGGMGSIGACDASSSLGGQLRRGSVDGVQGALLMGAAGRSVVRTGSQPVESRVVAVVADCVRGNDEAGITGRTGGEVVEDGGIGTGGDEGGKGEEGAVVDLGSFTEKDVAKIRKIQAAGRRLLLRRRGKAGEKREEEGVGGGKEGEGGAGLGIVDGGDGKQGKRTRSEDEGEEGKVVHERTGEDNDEEWGLERGESASPERITPTLTARLPPPIVLPEGVSASPYAHRQTASAVDLGSRVLDAGSGADTGPFSPQEGRVRESAGESTIGAIATNRGPPGRGRRALVHIRSEPVQLPTSEGEEGWEEEGEEEGLASASKKALMMRARGSSQRQLLAGGYGDTLQEGPGSGRRFKRHTMDGAATGSWRRESGGGRGRQGRGTGGLGVVAHMRAGSGLDESQGSIVVKSVNGDDERLSWLSMGRAGSAGVGEREEGTHGWGEEAKNVKDDEAPHRPGHKLHSHQSNMDSLIAKLDGFVDGELVMAEARDVPHATYSESRRELFQPFSAKDTDDRFPGRVLERRQSGTSTPVKPELDPNREWVAKMRRARRAKAATAESPIDSSDTSPPITPGLSPPRSRATAARHRPMMSEDGSPFRAPVRRRERHADLGNLTSRRLLLAYREAGGPHAAGSDHPSPAALGTGPFTHSSSQHAKASAMPKSASNRALEVAQSESRRRLLQLRSNVHRSLRQVPAWLLREWDDKTPGDGTPPSRRDSDGLSDRWAFSLGATGLEVEVVEEGEGGGDAVEAPGELPPPWVSEAMEKAYWMGQVDARQKRKGSRSSRSLPRSRARSMMGSESTKGYGGERGWEGGGREERGGGEAEGARSGAVHRLKAMLARTIGGDDGGRGGDDDGDPGAMVEPVSRGSSDKGHGWSPGTSPTLGGAALMGGGFGVSAIRAVRDRPGRAWEGETLGPPRTASTDALVGPAELPSDSDAKPSRMWALRAKAVAGRE